MRPWDSEKRTETNSKTRSMKRRDSPRTCLCRAEGKRMEREEELLAARDDRQSGYARILPEVAWVKICSPPAVEPIIISVSLPDISSSNVTYAVGDPEPPKPPSRWQRLVIGTKAKAAVSVTKAKNGKKSGKRRDVGKLKRLLEVPLEVFREVSFDQSLCKF